MQVDRARKISSRWSTTSAVAQAGGGAAGASRRRQARARRGGEHGAVVADEDDAAAPSALARAAGYVQLPLEKLFALTVPSCSEEAGGLKHRYPATFVGSIVWIGVLSFAMVDFTARAGCVLRIPPLLMGLVFIAAGTSVPDALSSISVARAGEGDMAVANVLGSTIFNILLGLALPWFSRRSSTGEPFALSEDEPILSSVLVLIAFLAYFCGSSRGRGLEAQPRDRACCSSRPARLHRTARWYGHRRFEVLRHRGAVVARRATAILSIARRARIF